MLVLIWVTVVIVSLVLYLRDVQSRLRRRQLRSLPALPLLGHMGKVVLRREHLTKTLQRSYEAFPEDKIVGHYEFINPIYLVRDIELLKRVTVKDFEYFVDKRFFGADDDQDPIFGRMLLLLKGGYIDVDVRDLTSRFANDVIATCAFGLNVNSMAMDNEFYKKAREVAAFNFQRFLKFIGFRSFPWLMKLFKITFITASLGEFFTTIVLGTMKQRERHNIIRHDMIHLLMEAKKGKLSHDNNTTDTADGFAAVEESTFGKKNVKSDWTDTDLIAQVVIFILAGFGTVSTVTSFLLHEMAANPDVQDKVFKEIMENEAKNGRLDYDSIQKMIYMDMVVSETLRMWPPAPMLDRVCVKSYNAGKPNKTATKDFVVNKGEVLTIPVWAFHRDPQYFPDPNKFDPERFSVENRHNIKPFTYMPFGVGPRNCIGSRFALCEVKIMLYQLLKNFELSLCEKSCVPAQLANGILAMDMSGGHWLRIKMRQQYE